MRKPSAVTMLSLLLALSWIGFLTNSPQADDAQPVVQKWEYRIHHSRLSNAAAHDVAGNEGWEAYAATPEITDGRTAGHFSIYFKRPKN
jgi:hypothetical protein